MRHLRAVSQEKGIGRPERALSLLELQQIATVLAIFADAFAGFTAAFIAIGDALAKGDDA